MNSETRMFRTFLAVAQSGSMREAASIIHLAQSAVSRQIVMLEEEVGVPLFDRLPRGVKLTSAGEMFVKHARESLKRAEKIRNEIDALRGLRYGVIRLETAESFTSGFLPKAMAEIQSRYPAVEFDVKVTNTGQVVESVLQSQADFGVAYNVPANINIASKVLVRSQMGVFVRPGHPLLLGRKAISLADIGNFPVALPATFSSSRMLIDSAADALNIQLRSGLTTDSVQLRLNVAVNSNLVVLVGRVAALRWLDDHSLVELELRDKKLSDGRVELLTLKGRRLSAAAQAFETALETASVSLVNL